MGAELMVHNPSAITRGDAATHQDGNPMPEQTQPDAVTIDAGHLADLQARAAAGAQVLADQQVDDHTRLVGAAVADGRIPAGREGTGGRGSKPGRRGGRPKRAG